MKNYAAGYYVPIAVGQPRRQSTVVSRTQSSSQLMTQDKLTTDSQPLTTYSRTKFASVAPIASIVAFAFHRSFPLYRNEKATISPSFAVT
jgi:hypothetical protein